MSTRPDQRVILETQEFFGLPSPALVEKDWHVVRALAAIHDVNVDGLTLAFGGGTALGRAYGLLERMSEDIDLRIVGDKAGSRPALRRLRDQVTERLAAAGFVVEGNRSVKQNDRFVRYDLPYEPIARGEGVLRPEIKIELAAFPCRRPTVQNSVCSFVAEAAKEDPEIAAVSCVALTETAAEKFVALSRRSGEAISNKAAFDPTLVRHVYDLSRLESHYDENDAASLALEIMAVEGATRAADYPAYGADPKAETLQVIMTLAEAPGFAELYENLMRDMVYGEKPSFSAAMTALQGLAERVRSA